MKKFLNAGQKITQYGGNVIVGKTGTCVDTVIDWKEVEIYSGDEGVAQYVNDGITYNVYIDDESGKFFIDDECGF